MTEDLREIASKEDALGAHFRHRLDECKKVSVASQTFIALRGTIVSARTDLRRCRDSSRRPRNASESSRTPTAR